MSEADGRLAVTAATPVGQPVNPIATEAVDAARAYAREALAPETLRAYAADWRHFAAWCLDAGCPSLPAPPLAVAAHLPPPGGPLSPPAPRRPPAPDGPPAPPRRPRLAGAGSAVRP